ncbi:hypothetical protein Pelo_1558 [Pelomyxa schiedti]|nr:hypothetical protein Pelo_1558 [Pelomyxa schiedti]
MAAVTPAAAVSFASTTTMTNSYVVTPTGGNKPFPVVVHTPPGAIIATALATPSTAAADEATGAENQHGSDQYPLVIFGHGWQATSRNYDSLLRMVASSGVIVVACDACTGIFPNHTEYGLAILHTLVWAVKQFDTLVNKASIHLAGHSLGGAVSLLAATNLSFKPDSSTAMQVEGAVGLEHLPRVQSIIAVSPCDTSPSLVMPSVVPALQNIQCNVVLVEATQDHFVPASKGPTLIWNQMEKYKSNYALGIDSGLMDEMVAQLQHTFGISLSVVEVHRCISLAGVAALVKDKYKDKPVVPGGTTTIL